MAGLAIARRTALVVHHPHAIFRRRAAHGARFVITVVKAGDRMGDGLGHAVPAHQVHARALGDGQTADPRAPDPERLHRRRLGLGQDLHREQHHGAPGRAVLAGGAPEPAGGPARLQHGASPGPQGRQERVAQRIDVKQRPVNQVDIVGPQTLVGRAHTPGPQPVGVGHQHALGPRGGAGGILHGDGPARIGLDLPAWAERLAAQQEREAVGRIGGDGPARLGGGIVVGDHHPLQARRGLIHHGGQGGLGDRARTAAVFDVIAQLRRGAARIGGHRDGAQLGQGEPGQQEFRAVLQMHQDAVARGDAALLQSGGEAADQVIEFPVGVGARRRIEGRPGQQGLVAQRLALRLEQPRDVETGEGIGRRVDPVQHHGLLRLSRTRGRRSHRGFRPR